jgi:hypothetical protein
VSISPTVARTVVDVEAFAAVLYKVVRSPAVQGAVSHIVTSALNLTL